MKRSPGVRWWMLLGVLLFLFAEGCTLVGVPPRSVDSPSGPEGVEEAFRPPGGGAEIGERGLEGAHETVRGGILRDDVRALWVVRTTLTHPESIQAMVSRAASAGFNTLLVQVRGRADAFHESRIEPRSELLRDTDPRFDPLALVIREARERGLDVHAWINVHLVHGVGPLPEDGRHLVRARPGLLSVPRELAAELDRVDARDPRYVGSLLRHARNNQDRLEGLFTSPSHPEVHDRVLAVVEELATRYELDGIHLDYLRYPGPDYDYSYDARLRFRRWVASRIAPEDRIRLDRMERSDPLAYPENLPGLWSEFRRSSVDALVSRVSDRLAEIRPGMALTAAVRADHDDAYAFRYQDWDRWLERGWVDAVAPMAYTDRRELFAEWIGDAVARAGRERVWAGVGGYRTSYGGAVEQLRLALATGVGGVALFSYDWAVAEGPRRDGSSYLQALAEDVFGPVRAEE